MARWRLANIISILSISNDFLRTNWLEIPISLRKHILICSFKLATLAVMTKWDIFTVIFQLFTNPYWTVLNLCVCRVNSPPFSFLFKTQCQSLFFNGFMSRKMKWIQGSSPSVDGNVGSHVWNALPEPLLSKVELRM